MHTNSRLTRRAAGIAILLALIGAGALVSLVTFTGTSTAEAQHSLSIVAGQVSASNDSASNAPAATCTTSFPDVPPSDPFYSYVQCLHCSGIVSGFPDGTYRTWAPISRGQIAKIVSNAAGFHEDPGGQIYADVAPGDPFYDYINRLTHRGIVSGYPCPTGPGRSIQAACTPENPSIFLPNANATRGQMAKIVSNAAGFSEDVSGQTFADVPPGSDFYVWIERLASRHVVGGYDCGSAGEPCDDQGRPYYRPGSLVTRGQAAKIVAAGFPGLCQVSVPNTATTTATTAAATNTAAPSNTPGGPTSTPTTVPPTSTATSTATTAPTNTATTGPTSTASPSPTCIAPITNAVIDTSDPTENGYPSRPGQSFASTCNVLSTYPGTTDPAHQYHYDAYTYRNTGASPVCVTVTLTTSCYGVNYIYSTAYINSFDPTDPSKNFLAQLGASPPQKNSYSFQVAPSTSFVVVVNETIPDQGCGGYTLNVSGLSTPGCPVNP